MCSTSNYILLKHIGPGYVIVLSTYMFVNKLDTVWVNMSNQGGVDGVFRGLAGLLRGMSGERYGGVALPALGFTCDLKTGVNRLHVSKRSQAIPQSFRL